MNRVAFAPLATALVTALALVGLAGCANGTTSSHLAIDFPEGHDDVDTAVPYPEGVETYTATDQLRAWATLSGAALDLQDFGGSNCLDAIDMIPTPGSCDKGAIAYWSLSVNGVDASVGMDDVDVNKGDKVRWTYTPLTSSPASSEPLTLEVRAPEVTQTDTVRLAGTVSRDALLSAVVGVATATKEVAAGAWTMDVVVDHGHTVIAIVADDGLTTTTEQVTAIRLTEMTFEAKFTAFPLHADIHDAVWFDMDGFASLAMYNGTSTAHPAFATVHDVMVTWSNQSGTAIEYGGPGSFGYSVNKIDGIGQPLTASAPPYWCYKLNGNGTDVLGITAQEVQPGDVVTWEFAGCA